MTTLQSFVFPNLDMPADESMYVRLDDGAWADLTGRKIAFEAGSTLSSDTYFSGFSVDAWKRYGTVESLALRLHGAGEFVVTLGLHRMAQASVWLVQQRISLLENRECALPVEAWPTLAGGLLFARIRALGPAVLFGASFETGQVPANRVRLGIVITHFNRQAQVEGAVRRITSALLDHATLRNLVTLTVVDNSRNLTLEPHAGLRHIRNRNLGGTGGFVRGLLALTDDASHTHCLFMDDDASCETESIARTIALLRFAKSARLSVAGALLREVAPWELLEKGARFDGEVVPMHPGLDVRRVDDLLESERDIGAPDYGAWWFFAFPLAAVERYPFPFFVRGDDIFFGLHNRFEIATLNGVACLGEDFSAKHGPMTAYLDARYHLVHALLGDRRHARKAVYWVGSRLFVKALTGYLYTSAGAVTLAIRHVMEGPAFFHDNLDMTAVRALLNARVPGERLVAREGFDAKARPPRARRESAPRRIFRALTLQGFLLPGFLLRDRTTRQPKSFHGRASAIFRYRRVLYEHAPSHTSFVAEFDRPRFFGELTDFLKVWLGLFWRLDDLRRLYADEVVGMSSADYWRRVYAGAVEGAVDTPSEPARH